MSRFEDNIPLDWQAHLWSHVTASVRRGQLPHALLLTGSAGLGKGLFARALARYIVCRHRQEDRHCGACTDCLLGQSQLHPDITLVQAEQDSKVIKIDQIRSVIELLQRTSHGGGAKVALIEAAHDMNSSSVNALLKTLEEPAGDTYIILISDMPGHLPATIRSRCSRLLMPTPAFSLVVEWLKSHSPVDGHEDLERAVAAARCCPLKALEIVESGALERRDDVVAKLTLAQQGRLNPQSLLAQLSGVSENALIEYLLDSLTIVITYLLANRRPRDGGREVEGLLDSFAAASSHSKGTALRLLQLHEESLLASRQLLSGNNPNPRLVVESLLWRWCQLATGNSG